MADIKGIAENGRIDRHEIPTLPIVIAGIFMFKIEKLVKCENSGQMIDTINGLCYDRITYERIRSFECGELTLEDIVSKIP